MPSSSGFQIKPIPTYLSPKTSPSSAIFFVTISMASDLLLLAAFTHAIARSSAALLEFSDELEHPATKIKAIKAIVNFNLFIFSPFQLIKYS